MKFDITEERQKNSQTHYIATIIISKKQINKKIKIKPKKNTQKQKITRHYQIESKIFFLKKTIYSK